MKVVINRCFGGFGLSNSAFELLLTRKGIAFETTEAKFKLTGDLEYYHAGHTGSDDHYLSYHEFCDDRSDLDLIAVVEELGDAASGSFANLAIVEIPDDVEWEIVEYDGSEHVAEKHRTWY